MPSRKFALEPGGPARLVVKWTGLWKSVSVQLDGLEVLTFADQAALTRGGRATLPDGRKLKVTLVKEFVSTGMHIEIDGTPVPGSDGDPLTRIKTAYGVIYVVAALSALCGLAAELFEVKFMLDIGMGLITVAAGGLFAGLGFLVQPFHSRVALGVAVALFAIDGVATMQAIAANGGGGVGGIVFRLFLLVAMVRGFAPLQTLHERRKASAPGSAP